jgi:hypothetical protein
LFWLTFDRSYSYLQQFACCDCILPGEPWVLLQFRKLGTLDLLAGHMIGWCATTTQQWTCGAHMNGTGLLMSHYDNDDKV